MLRYEGHTCYPAGYEDDSDASADDFLPPPSLRITVVPNITKGAGLNWEDFDATLTEEMETWFVSFEKMWNIYKRTPSMIQNLKSIYLNDDNPLLLALKFFSRCPGCNNLKNKNLALFVLDTVCAVYKTNPEIAENCTDNMRMVAFNFIKTCGVLPLYKNITEAYELTKIKDLLMVKIQELIDDKRYKDAAYWAINLRVTQCFDIYQIVLPLILQSNSSLAVECLDLAKDQQEETVRFLDSLLDKQKSVIDHCFQLIEKHGYIDLNHSVISFRPMSKLVARLAKMYDIGTDCTPNLSYTKSWSYMYYLYKRFKDGNMSRDSFRELVKDAATTATLRQDLVSNIASHGDRDEALYWVKLYQIPTDQWPSILQTDTSLDADQGGDAVDGWEPDHSPSNQSNSSVVSSGRHSKGEYLQLELRDEDVILVDRRSTFMAMIRVLETQSLIGFDSEWKPSACEVESVSLLQLATFSKVFLIDVTSEKISDYLWKLLGRNIFNNLEILKIGFALQQDLNMLQKSLPQMNICLASTSCYLDLKDLWKRLMYLQCFTFPYKGTSRAGTSLSALTEICLGKKLDKSNQVSNWAKRPLRRDQIVYAAVDVFCLLQIYKVISDSLSRLGYDIDQMVDQITSSNSTKPDKMANKSLDSSGLSKLSRKPSRTTSLDSTSSTDIRFFCDGMLGGLLHNLRRLGIDCLEINGRVNIEQYLRRAQQEHRHILARDARFTQNAAKYQAKDLCLEVPEDAADVQVVNVIQYFNIAINRKNVNPRCPTCNGLEFISATRHQMQILKFGVSPQEVSFTSSPNAATHWNKSIKFVFQSCPITEEILTTGKTFSQAAIKVGKLSTNNVFAHNVFFICDKCGRITWPSDYHLSSKIEQQILAEE